MGDLSSRWRSYCKDTDGDVEGFIGHLHREGLIPTRVFCELLSGSRLEVDEPIDNGDDDGHYRFLGVVGRGATGDVHLAKDLRLRRNVAFKEMHPLRASKPHHKKRFLNEIRITAQLDHPNIVPVYNLEMGHDTPAFSMKLIHGATLEEILEEMRQRRAAGRPAASGPTLEVRLEHFVKVCDAMAYAHQRGVIHRDLKPSNIMVGPFNEVYVMDWGIAKLLGIADEVQQTRIDLNRAEIAKIAARAAAKGDTTDVRRTHARGTPAYMSPEQARGEALDPRSDQFSLGLVLYELASLERGRPSEGFYEVLAQAGQGEVAAAPSHVPADLVAVVAKATAPRRRDRYEDVGALAEDIRRYLRGEAPLVRPDNLWRHVLRAVSRRRQAALVLMLLLALATAAALVGVLAVAKSAERREERLSARLTTVATRASHANSYFTRLQGLLQGLADAAVHLLVYGEPSNEAIYYHGDYAVTAKGPPDLAMVGRYQVPVSFTWPVVKLASGVEAARVEPVLRRLLPLRRHFRRTFLRSHSEDSAFAPFGHAEDLLGERGVPLIWAYVALEDGAHVSYPGHPGYPEAYDPRRRPWYVQGRQARGPQWVKPYIDVNGQGLILPCVTSLWRPGGREPFIGVAGIELTFDLIIDTLLATPDLAGVEESFLVDGEGQVMVRSGALGTAVAGGLHGNKLLETELLAEPRVVEAIRQERSGYLEAEDSLYVYDRLDSLGWYLVVKASRL